MTPRATTAAIEIWEKWQAQGATLPLDRIVNEEVRARKSLNSRERRWLTDAIYRNVRLLTRQEALCKTMGMEVTAESLIRLWEMETSREPQEELVKALAQLPAKTDPAGYLRTTLSYPEALAKELEVLLGDEAVAAGEALNEQAPTVIRVNSLKSKRERVLKQVEGSYPTNYSPWGVVLPKREPIQGIPGYREGRFEVQEEASQLAILFAEAKPNETIIEIGAGGGGKTLGLAAAMENTGRIFALDTSATRLASLEKRLPRAGVTIVQTVQLTANEMGVWGSAPWSVGGKYERGADCVFIDTPCTGSGTLRRNPDKKWFGAEVGNYPRLQSILLEQGSHLVRRGGRLCYITCALERSQNEKIVEAFLQSPAGKDFKLDGVPASLALFAEGKYFRTWAHRHGLDLFFGAKLRRKG